MGEKGKKADSHSVRKMTRGGVEGFAGRLALPILPKGAKKRNKKQIFLATFGKDKG